MRRGSLVLAPLDRNALDIEPDYFDDGFVVLPRVIDKSLVFRLIDAVERVQKSLSDLTVEQRKKNGAGRASPVR